MTWRDELRPASFRGVAFQVESDSGTFGRRTQVHEYPQRDKPWTDDLGRASRHFEITAFLIGDDYLQQRDALLGALEEKGPGTLVHPWYGELQVNVKDPARVSHSRLNGGMCEVSLSFVEAGELEFPAASSSLGAQSLEAADELADASELDFADLLSFEGFSSFVRLGFLDDLGGFVRLLLGASSAWSWLTTLLPEWDDDPQGLAPGLLPVRADAPARFAASTLRMFERTVLPASTFGADRLNRNAVVALTALSRQYGAYVQPAVSTAPSARQRELNRAALAALFQRATLIQAAGMSAVMPLPVYDDAVLVRDSLAAALDEASYAAPDAIYVLLQTLRARVHADITARLSRAARLLDYTPREPLPALALVYDLYEDVAREQELIDRNALRHPGFVPARAIKVLSA